jgi:hypothetical protein
MAKGGDEVIRETGWRSVGVSNGDDLRGRWKSKRKCPVAGSPELTGPLLSRPCLPRGKVSGEIVAALLAYFGGIQMHSFLGYPIRSVLGLPLTIIMAGRLYKRVQSD